MATQVDDFFHQAFAPLMRPGESPIGLGFMSNVVPVVARLIPIVASYYVGHHIVLATNQRIVLASVAIDFVGNPKMELRGVHAIELADIAHVELFDPHILLHHAVRITRRNGHVSELMYPSTKAAVASQSQFASNFPSWLAQGVGAGQFAPVPGAPDPRTPDLPLPPLALTYWMLVVGSILTCGVALLALSGMFMGQAAFGFGNAIVVLAAGYGLSRLWRKISERKALLAGRVLAPAMTRSRYLVVASGVLLGLALVLLPWTTFNWYQANKFVDQMIEQATRRRAATIAAYGSGDRYSAAYLNDYRRDMETGRDAIASTNSAASEARTLGVATVLFGALFAGLFVRDRASKGAVR